MAKVGKRIAAAREGIDRNKLYALDEAIGLVKGRAKTKFDETVEVAINLGVMVQRFSGCASHLRSLGRLQVTRIRF